MSKLRIVVGPTAMYVEREGVRSSTQALTEAHGPAEVRQISRDLWQEIRPMVSWTVWERHRFVMACQRAYAAKIKAIWPGPYFVGLQPHLVAQKPWGKARYGEWAGLPPGVVGRLIRGAA